MRWLALCVRSCAGALTAGCAGPMSVARKAFSEAYFYPQDRVTVTPHAADGRSCGADIRPPAAAPPDIANDPARLELWKKKQERDAGAAAAARSDRRLVDAEGRGQRHTYRCEGGDVRLRRRGVGRRSEELGHRPEVDARRGGVAGQRLIDPRARAVGRPDRDRGLSRECGHLRRRDRRVRDRLRRSDRA